MLRFILLSVFTSDLSYCQFSTFDLVNKTSLGERPYVVSVTNRLEQHQFSGVIITNWHVLSVCGGVATVTRNWHKTVDPTLFKVLGGFISFHNHTGRTGIQRRMIKAINVHPFCQMTNFGVINDIALLDLDVPFILNVFVKPAPLPFMQEGLNAATLVATILVFPDPSSCSGNYWLNLHGSDLEMYTVGTKILTAFRCYSILSAMKADHTKHKRKELLHKECDNCIICSSNKFNVCHTSSYGSPLFCNQRLIGLWTHGQSCEDRVKVSKYARVDQAMSWICGILAEGGGWVNASSSILVLFILVCGLFL